LRIVVTTLISDGNLVGAQAVIADRTRGFELPQAYFLTTDKAHRISGVTVYWDSVSLGLQLTKAGAEGLVHAITNLGKP